MATPKTWLAIQRDLLLPAFEAVIAATMEPMGASLTPFSTALSEAWWRVQVTQLWQNNNIATDSEKTRYQASFVARQWYWEKIAQKEGNVWKPHANYSVISIPYPLNNRT